MIFEKINGHDPVNISQFFVKNVWANGLVSITQCFLTDLGSILGYGKVHECYGVVS